MGIFNNLLSKIFSHAGQTAPTGGGSPPTTASGAPTSPGAGQTATAGAGSTPASTSGAPASAGAGQAPSGVASAGAANPSAAPARVDVAAVMDKLAASNSEKLDWKRSIVDLMKLVGMDSSFSARKELAHELHYTGDTGDSAAMNMWLHKEVLRKISENGGKVPADLLK